MDLPGPDHIILLLLTFEKQRQDIEAILRGAPSAASQPVLTLTD